MLNRIKNLPKKLLNRLEFEHKSLSVYRVEDYNLISLKSMVDFGLDIFGDLGMDEWGLVPQIRHGGVYIVKEEGQSQLIGLAILMRDWEDPLKAYLFDYAIASGYRGVGIGYEFLKIICSDLLEQGFESISLTVDIENDSAIKLYEDKIGFDKILYSKDEYGKGQDRFIMDLNLHDFKNEQL